MMRIGYLGLGAMGGALSAHLAKAFDLTVFDRNPNAMAGLVALGAKAALSPAELARSCDVILLCLPRSSDVQDALFSPGGLAEGFGPGKLVIDQSSGVPGVTSAIAQKLAAFGVAMLDAPVSGGIPAAQIGAVTIIASGADDAWANAEPVLRAMTQKVFRCSDRVGDGQALKLVNNAIGAGYRMATLELVAVGRKLGLRLSQLVETLDSGQGANFTTRNMLAGLVAGRSTTNFALLLMVKDLNEALALGSATSAPMPMTAGARGLMQIGLNLLGKNAKLDDVIPLTEQLADIKLSDAASTSSTPLASGVTDAELLAAIELSTIACNTVAVCECVAVGRNFGLRMAEMARILNVGSAWSETSARILPALANDETPLLGATLGEANAAVTLLVRLAADACVPLMLPNAALGCLQTALNTKGKDADLGSLSTLFQKPQANGQVTPG